ncbi:MAG: pyruvate flavodoxin/ferredoxin oxidoreductase [Actinobacteria bacterium]|nr:pyruvate flavodoxin/ferredoxin oxidoreductase [Actinomycetota bacterium]
MPSYIDGSTAIVLGALDAGCDFFAGYPITPASPILMALMRDLPRSGGVAVQGEDEIASIGMCIGASLAGARAMTATSGPGISLYSENLGLAVMGEVPLVVIDVQRLGPATGGATTVAQGDVQFVRWGTSGGYPIIALAPSTIAECYTLTMRAFDLAERFRCPVFVLTDKDLNLTMGTADVGAFPPAEVRARAVEEAPDAMYRYEPSDETTPMVRYGTGRPVRFTGSTHDEHAFITKDPARVGALNRHLIDKIEEHRDEIEMVDADLQDGAATLVVSYGSTAAVMRTAVRRARAAGAPVSMATVHSLWPVPETALVEAMAGVERVVVAELNPGLYAREIERIAAGREVRRLTRIDGEMLAPEEFQEALA